MRSSREIGTHLRGWRGGRKTPQQVSDAEPVFGMHPGIVVRTIPSLKSLPLNTHELSAALFARGLTNLKTQLAKAESHAVAIGVDESTLLNARLVGESLSPDIASVSPRDLHMYTLAAQVHWAAEGAKLAIGHLLGEPQPPATNVAQTFSELQQHLDETIAYFRAVSPADLDAGLERTIVINHPRGATSATGSQFLVAFAIPHFYYHLTAAYSILRNQGVKLMMGDFVGSWGAS